MRRRSWDPSGCRVLRRRLLCGGRLVHGLLLHEELMQRQLLLQRCHRRPRWRCAWLLLLLLLLLRGVHELLQGHLLHLLLLLSHQQRLQRRRVLLHHLSQRGTLRAQSGQGLVWLCWCVRQGGGHGSAEGRREGLRCATWHRPRTCCC